MLGPRAPESAFVIILAIIRINYHNNANKLVTKE